MSDSPNYYAIIPASVRYDSNLKPNAKLLYGEITALTNDKGYCWASNDYFAELYKTKKETVSRWISQLEKNKHIKTQVMYKPNTKQIIERRIWITTPIDKKANTYCQKNQDPIDKKVNTPIDKKVKDNNTSINNTFNTFHADTIKHFTEKYIEVYGVTYPFAGGRDGKVVKELISKYDYQFLVELIDWYFNTDDDWINKTGRAISMLPGQINKFVANKKKGEVDLYSHIKVAGVND